MSCEREGIGDATAGGRSGVGSKFVTVVEW